jgi:hypothetical protein
MTSNTWATRAQSRSRTFLTLARTAPSSGLSTEQGREPEWCANCFCYVCDAPASRVAPCGLSTAWRRTHRLCGSSAVGRVWVRSESETRPSHRSPIQNTTVGCHLATFGSASFTVVLTSCTLERCWPNGKMSCASAKWGPSASRSVSACTTGLVVSTFSVQLINVQSWNWISGGFWRDRGVRFVFGWDSMSIASSMWRSTNEPIKHSIMNESTPPSVMRVRLCHAFR